MSELTRKFALSLGLGLGVIGFSSAATAQETTTGTTAETAQVPADAPTTDNLSMGTEAAGEPAVGSTYTVATFELWEQRCVKTAEGADPCQLYQLLKDAEGNSVAEISMFALPEGSEATAGATVVAPLETLLTANLTLGVDGGDMKMYQFNFCATIGCIARVGFTADEVARFKKGAKAIMTIVPAAAPDQKVVLEISLKGFTAGYEAVQKTIPVLPKPAN